MTQFERFGDALVAFALDGVQATDDAYKLAFLNYYGALLSGAHEEAITILVKTCTDYDEGHFVPIARQELMSLSNAVMVDCFSSAILAYDDIHFETTTHPCGPCASAILGISRIKRVSLHEALIALATGMEVECRIGRALFSKGSGSASGWYTTGIAGVIGAAVSCAKLLGFNHEQMASVIGLSASYACGVRGTHGSMAGSFVPAMAAKSGFEAAMLVKNGFTCHLSALTGVNGLIRQIAPNANIEEAMEAMGSDMISKKTSCKPYPLGFISFAMIHAMRQLKDVDMAMIKSLDIFVSERVFQLGHNRSPSTYYDSIVSLPYIAARMMVDVHLIYQPPLSDFKVTKEEQAMIDRIHLHSNPTMTDDAVKIIVDGGRLMVQCTNAYGSSHHPMTSQDVLDKFKRISHLSDPDAFIDTLSNEDIDDLYGYLKSH